MSSEGVSEVLEQVAPAAMSVLPQLEVERAFFR